MVSMGFFNKETKREREERSNSVKNEISEIPSLPELPTLPELPLDLPKIKSMDNQKISGLPSLPNSPMGERFTRENMKDIIKENISNQMPIKESRTYEISDWNQSRQISKQSQPLFIKLETFERAISSFNEIKLRISEIESLLRNIKEIKDREESELNEWESEIEHIKSRLEQINQEIFENIE